jgi:hypothetical protein
LAKSKKLLVPLDAAVGNFGEEPRPNVERRCVQRSKSGVSQNELRGRAEAGDLRLELAEFIRKPTLIRGKTLRGGRPERELSRNTVEVHCQMMLMENPEATLGRGTIMAARLDLKIAITLFL